MERYPTATAPHLDSTPLFAREFPMTVTGKVQKYLIRQQLEQELGVERARTA